MQRKARPTKARSKGAIATALALLVLVLVGLWVLRRHTSTKPDPARQLVAEFRHITIPPQTPRWERLLIKLGLREEKEQPYYQELEGAGFAKSERLWKEIVLLRETAVPALIDSMESDEDFSRKGSAWFPPSPQAPTEEDIVDFNTKVVFILADIGPVAIPYLLEALKHRNGDVRSVTTVALGLLGGWSEPVVPALTEALEDRDPTVRFSAARALEYTGRNDPKVARALAGVLLKDANKDVRAEAAGSLRRRFGPAADNVLPALIRAMKDPEPDVRRAAAGTLGQIGPPAKAAAPHLIEALEDKHRPVRGAAAYALRGVRSKAPQAIEALLATAKDGDEHEDVRVKALRALHAIAPQAPETRQALTEGLQAPNSRVRYYAAKTLLSLGHWEKALPSLIDDTGKRHPDNHPPRLSRPLPKEAAGLLIEALTHPNTCVRKFAAQELGAIDHPGTKAIDALARALKDPKAYVRLAATEALGRIGPAAAPAAPALIQSLEDCRVKLISLSNQRQADPVAIALRRIGPGRRSRGGGAPAIMALLKHPDSKVRDKAIEALSWVLPPPVATAVSALKEQDPKIRAGAAEALGRMGPSAAAAAAPLVKALKDQDQDVRVSAAAALARLGRYDQALPVLVACLKDNDSQARVRGEAAQALGRSGLHAKEAVPALVQAAENGWVRYRAVQALDAIGAKAAGSVKPVILTLKHAREPARVHAANALGKIAPDGEAVVPALVAALKDKEKKVRSAAARALGKLGPSAHSAAGPLAHMLRDHEFQVRRSAVVALGKIGADPNEVVPHLIWALGDCHWKVRSDASQALGGIGTPAAPALIAALKDDNPLIRMHAADALGRIEPGPKGAIAPLVELTVDLYSRVRCRAAIALMRLGEVDRGCPLLVRILKHRETMVRRAAAEGLAAMGSKAKPALPALTEALEDEDPDTRYHAAVAVAKAGHANLAARALGEVLSRRYSDKREQVVARLAELGGDAAPAVPALVETLKNRDANVRRLAAVALGNIGPHAGKAAPALRAALRDRKYAVHEAAREALKKIQQLGSR